VTEVTTASISALLCLEAPASRATGPAVTDPHTTPVKETTAAVGQISHELKLTEARLGKIEGSVAGVDASLAPVGALAQPATLRGLILLAACAAGLIVLHAVLRRWSAPPRKD
jgi:hypothetical protein